ncbi:AfsA-related hotdog domain-containing protein [Streptomyces beihaiensis]|uniref:AfsA-related hotdog domain-containing protein n=1 Tax=Streptomyces beihaiensis TaxID=2984495 RepID=A0ABT3TSA5_9ACTN|nr:AfsA-related hotdog domain-containing protein [Streptomyces beihaiensis]MCX3059915.1 AfsA-related hotdog domain-containing protein [Streptomyces beihaiensis]
MSRHAAPGDLGAPAVARQLVHRERPHDAPSGEERFRLDADMPLRHPLFNDDPERRDAHVFLELLRGAGLGIGHRHFNVPTERAGVFYKFALRLTDPRVWCGPAENIPLALELRAWPTKSVAGVPRGLRLAGALEIDGRPGCDGSAELVFLTPTVARNHRAASRLAALGRAASGAGRVKAGQPVEPAEVGRVDPDNVVVARPRRTGSVLRSQVLVDVDHPVFFAEGADSVPGLLLVEAVRQGSLLAAGRVHGLKAHASTLTSMSVHVRGHGELDLPLRCTAVADGADQDDEGRRRIRIGLRLEQAGKVTAEAQTVVTETG